MRFGYSADVQTLKIKGLKIKKMKRLFYSFAVYLVCIHAAAGQERGLSADSVNVRILPAYDSVGRFHRKVFGENYRKEYSMETKVPLIRLSAVAGGLKAVQRGGGFQTRSLRLEDAAGNEWVLRSIEKYPEVLLPPGLRETFVSDVLKDNMSAQHPFAALIVPVLADAIGAPHSNPVIGLVAPDPGLGGYGAEFQNTVCLLEEREPIGKSDNTAKMYRKLASDNRNTYNAEMYLKLKCLDVLIGDWDRHDDQWRWRGLKSPSGISYMPIGRDRDQVFYRSDGWIQRSAQSTWFLPMMQGYERDVQNINWFLWEGREINSKWLSQIDRVEWKEIISDFVGSMTDEVLERALLKLPEPGYSLRHDEFLKQLKARRAQIPALMNEYYRFFNRIVDVELSDKHESVRINDIGNGGISVLAVGLDKAGNVKKQVYQRNFDPEITSEVRIYLHGGNDRVSVETRQSRIRLRVVGEKGQKDYDIPAVSGKLSVYGRTDSQLYSGKGAGKLKKYLSDDSANTAYVAKDLYKRHIIYPNLGFNNDDGLALGLSFKVTNPGFRKAPYGNSQSFSFLYSFRSSALKLYYTGEWLEALGRADLVLQASAFAPSNTQNFFGLGNQTAFEKGAGSLKYYRARFNLYELNPSLRWRNKKSVFSAGLAYQYYTYDEDENRGRFISQPAQLHSSDSSTVSADKMFVGAVLKYTLNTRDNDILPTRGINLEVKLTAHEGLNRYSNAFGQINSSISFHQKIDSAARVVLVDRIGGGTTVGRPAFYQAQFLGGQGNLTGYRQYRFAGEHSIFNNLEMRVKLGDFISYVLPGQIGLLGMYDVGRVWKRDEDSRAWHHGVGTGLYFTPASLSVIKLVASYSKEGWYPYFSMNFRY